MVMNINTAGLAEGLGLSGALGLDLTMLREVFSQTGANSRAVWVSIYRSRAPQKEQYDRMIKEGLGELNKSGVAELTFKDRHKRSGDHV
jgi:3-hydroxyisobutyrate dehydrogenase